MVEEGGIVGVDLGDATSNVCVLDADGGVMGRREIPTTPRGITEYFGNQAAARVVLEVGSQSPWVSRQLAALGHDVIVANARQLGLIHGSKRKNDRLDAERLARLARVDVSLLAPIKRRNERLQQDLAVVRARDELVRARTALINHVRGVFKAFGVRAPQASAAAFHKRVLAHVPAALEPAILPLLESLQVVTAQVRALDRRIEALARDAYPETMLLTQVRGVGNLIALAFVLTLADPTRFRTSRQVGTYLGLAPGQDQSGDSNPQRGITKQGDALLRKLLVQAAHYILGPFGADSDLRRYGLAIAERGGGTAKKRAMIAVARKLAVLLHHLWSTGEVYQPLRSQPPATT